MTLNQYSLAFIILIIFTTNSHAATNMRCGNRLISVGDSKAEVLLKCGEPMLKETIGEKEQSRRIDFPLSSEPDAIKADAGSDSNNRTSKSDTASISRKESVTKIIDHWTYNQGSGKLLKILIFEGGKLVEIASGDRNQ